jgi:predicted RNA-binding Zn ribbon-like protein
MGKKERSAENLELIGGQLCLDFANTVSTRVKALRHEYLTDYGELVVWSRHAGLLSADEAQALLHEAARFPDRASAVLDRAIALRETLYRLFSALAAQREPEAADLATLNAALREVLAHLEIAPSTEGFEWTWMRDSDDLDQMLWPVVRSAADLLTNSDLERVCECAREGCDWLFLDTSKNRSRRWCSMDMCGSRTKARRYYRRKRREETASISSASKSSPAGTA